MEAQTHVAGVDAHERNSSYHCTYLVMATRSLLLSTLVATRLQKTLWLVDKN